VGIFIPLMALWLGPKIWHAGENAGLITQAQFLGTQFNSQVLRSLAATIGLVSLIPYIAVQMMGGGYILSVTTHGHIPFWLGSSVAFGVVPTYVYSGVTDSRPSCSPQHWLLFMVRESERQVLLWGCPRVLLWSLFSFSANHLVLVVSTRVFGACLQT
jgi:hypothetical protein